MKIQSATYLGICIAALGCSGKPSTQGQPEQGQTEQAPEQTGARKSPSPGNADDAPAKNQPAAAPSPDGASAPPPPGALGRLDHPDSLGMTHPRAGTAMFEVETGKYEVKSLIEDKVNVSSMAVSPDLERLAAPPGISGQAVKKRR